MICKCFAFLCNVNKLRLISRSRSRSMYIIHILIVISLETVLIACSSNSIKIKCTNVDEVYYAFPGTQCTAYYKCISKGQYQLVQCASGTFFQFHLQRCTPEANTCREPHCTVRSKGLHQDVLHSCKRYFTCHAGHVTSVDNCPPDHQHDGHKCVHENLVPCSEEQNTSLTLYTYPRDERCANRANGKYAVVDDCNQFIVCAHGKVSEIKHCPPEQYFHDERKLCLSKQWVPQCDGKAGYKYEASIGAECSANPNGLVRDPSSVDCSGYLICRNGEIESKARCVDQAIFNGHSCVPNILYKCPNVVAVQNLEMPDFCHRKLNGLYANPRHGCATYLRCMSERVAEVRRCQGGQYFDPEARRCIHVHSDALRWCHERGPSSDCDGKSDGYYRYSDCDSYYHCHMGQKTEYRCSVGKVYNGESCVPKHLYKCPNEYEDRFCLTKPEGYHKDPNDGCRSYHYCLGGQKVTYLCEPHYVFDESTMKCEHQNKFDHLPCQTDQQCYGKSDGYHADLSSNCRNYVYCKNYEKITQLTCRGNNIFNGQQCVSPDSSYTCPSLYNHRSQNCISRQRCLQKCERDGFYPSLNDDCREYYFCIAGKLTKLSCPAGKRFNGELCVPADQFNCPVFCESSDNSDKYCPLGGYMA